MLDDIGLKEGKQGSSAIQAIKVLYRYTGYWLGIMRAMTPLGVG